MKSNLKFHLILCFLVFSIYASAQDRNIKGTVFDENNNGLPGATILIKGTSTGIITDSDGNFSISAPENSVLIFSYVGYLPEEITIVDQSVINISLVPEISNLDEVVVVGYGVQKKSLVTGSIAKVKSDDIVSTPSLRVEQAL